MAESFKEKSLYTGTRLFAEVGRGFSCDAFEILIEVLERVIPDLERNLGNGQAGSFQQVYGFVDPVFVDIGHEIHTSLLFKE
jgi:hypothetical protein